VSPGGAANLGGGGSGGTSSGGGGFSATGGVATGGSGGVATGGVGGTGALGGNAGSGGAAGSGNGCAPLPTCDGPLPNVGPKRDWKSITSSITAATGFANHRGRDLILLPTADQWILGKFAYGIIDKDIHGEEVDVWLERDCAGNWEKLGTELTTNDGDHATVEGVDDTGGRIYHQLSATKKLGIGRHRALLVVAGDLTTTEVLIDVVPAGTSYFLSDIDGTLTTAETEEYSALLTASVSGTHPDAPAALQLLAQKKYRPLYLTARPEFLVGRTREFVTTHGFPKGIVRTTLALGATGTAATSFKQNAINALTQKGFVVDFAFGNTVSDADAYFLSNIQPNDHRIFFQYTDSAHNSRRIESYGELLGDFGALAPVCGN
jgi:hypothetical protein